MCAFSGEDKYADKNKHNADEYCACSAGIIAGGGNTGDLASRNSDRQFDAGSESGLHRAGSAGSPTAGCQRYSGHVGQQLRGASDK